VEQENNSAQDLVQQLEIRRVYDKETETWYYSVVDAIAAPDPVDYWTKLKRRVKTEAFETVLLRVVQFKLKARDSKFRATDCMDREALLRQKKLLGVQLDEANQGER
jgi:DNA-damage-inducible protein D